MMRLLLFIKHRLTFIWSFAEFLNGCIFHCLFRKKILQSAFESCRKFSTDLFELRLLETGEMEKLSAFFLKQPQESYLYFKPHGFEVSALRKVRKNPAFLMFAIFNRNTGDVCGYFMMRFFANKKCFVGFLVDVDARGKGIAGLMGKTMLEICWNNNFSALATVSKKNEAALRAYRKLNNFSVLKELADDYIYIRYEKEID